MLNYDGYDSCLLEQQYSDVEREYCSTPEQCVDLDVLIVGSAIGLGAVPYLVSQSRHILGTPLRVGVVDAGSLSLLTHMAHTKFPRFPLLKTDTPRFGGKLPLWGVSTPRPPFDLLQQWPYPHDDLIRRFESVEEEMGVKDEIPKANGFLQRTLAKRLQKKFRSCTIRSAPLAINSDGRRWCPLDQIPTMAAQGVLLLPRFRCTALEVHENHSRIAAVHGVWMNGRSWTLHPKIVVLGVGIEQSLPLIRPICHISVPLRTADHLRIDLHGSLPPGHFGSQSVDALGVGVLIMEARSKSGVPYHLEIKVAPRGLWSRGYMQSSDNLRGNDNDATIWIQVQAVAAMHNRFPITDLLHVDGTVSPVMSARDALFHGDIVKVMNEVATVLGLAEPTFTLRPVLTNHHVYGAFRVGTAVTRAFRWHDIENLYVLPPTAYVDSDDDANPVLKSRVLSQYAMDDIVAQFISHHS